jgi:hypothetical protein
MTGQTTAPRRDRGRILLLSVLLLSLLLNAVAAGAALRAYRLRQDILGPETAAALFPRDYRREIGRAIAASDGAVKTAIRATVSARARVVQTGTARPFDRAATEAAMAELRRSADTALTLAQSVVLDALTAKAARDGAAQ